MNCDACDSKDQIEIAGKTFCASCGAVNSFVDKSSIGGGAVDNNSSQPNNRINTSYQMQPTQNPVQPNPPQANTSSEPVELEHVQVNSNNQINPVISNTQTQQPNLQSNITPSTNTTPSASQPPSVPTNPTGQTQPIIAAQPPTNTAQTPINPVVPAVNPNISDPNYTNSVNLPPAQNQAVPTNTLGSPNSTVQSENIGSEIGQLSKKDDLVFSDDELDQLANQKPETSSVVNPFADISDNLDRPNLQTRTMEDIRPSNNQPPPITTNSIPTNVSQTSSNYSAPVNDSVPFTPPTMQPVQNQVSQLNQVDATKNNLQANILTGQVEQPTKPSSLKKHSGKVASVGLSLAGVILLGIYVWQINYPNLALKVAGSKAGISASMPTYLPSGWKISGDIQANPGNINYKLASADGNKSVSVNEVRSDWDSQALAENYLSPNTDKYTALQSEGLTIYIYNNNQASWVNHGTWYRIEGQDHGLSRDQIIKMATSL